MYRPLLSLLCLSTTLLTTACASSEDASHTKIMPSAHVMEVLTYRTKSSVNEHKHITHASAYGAVLAQFDGFIGRNLAHNDDDELWVDISYWRDEQAAKKAHELLQSLNREDLREFFGDIQDKDGKFTRAEIILR
jgi:hypothetical protein